jgi:hypothetical protein
MSLSDAQRLPTYQRIWFMERTNKEVEAINNEVKRSQNSVKKGGR